jgi:hypothetical protein
MFGVECVLGPLAELCYPQRMKSHERRIIVHFDSAPIHITERVQEYLANVGFRRMEYSRYSLDLEPCDFFLFGAIKESFAGHCFDGLYNFLITVESFLSILSEESRYTIVQEWIEIAAMLQKWMRIR